MRLSTAHCFFVVSAFFSGVIGCGVPGEPHAPDCGLAPFVFDPHGDVLQGGDDGGCVRVERQAVPTEADFCFACPYALTRVVADTGDLRLDVTDPAALSYEPTHHNWQDKAVAVDGEDSAAVRILYVVDGDTWQLELTMLHGDSVVQGPLVLRPSGT